MNETEELRRQLILFVRRKFYTRQSIIDIADDIVNEAFLSACKDNSKMNFGYLSTVCLHVAYALFRKMDRNGNQNVTFENMLEFVDPTDVIEEILQSQDTALIFESLDTLKEIERVVIIQRYYGDYTFAEIAKSNNIRLNTILSHHRRALERLRPKLAQFSQDRVMTKKIPSLKGNFSKLF